MKGTEVSTFVKDKSDITVDVYKQLLLVVMVGDDNADGGVSDDDDDDDWLICVNKPFMWFIYVNIYSIE